MKRLVFSIATLAVWTAGASAADLMIMPEEPMAMQAEAFGYDWSGFYAGVVGGYGWGTYTLATVPPAPAVTQGIGIGGGLIGVDLGVNAQWDMFVLGAEADIAWSGMSGSAACTGFPAFTCAGDVDWLANIRGRAGIAVDRVLIFATAGLAVGGVSMSVTPALPGSTGTYSDTRVGWTLGAGAEVAVTEEMSVKAEYAYTDLRTRQAGAGTLAPLAADTSFAFHTVEVGVNFHF